MTETFTQRHPLLLLLFVSIALATLLAALWEGDSRLQARHAARLIELKQLDARLDREVLQVTSFLLRQYDPLVETTRRLRELGRWIQSPEASFYGHEGDAVDRAADAYRSAMERKIDLAEQIKSQAAVVRNGLHFLPMAVQALENEDPRAYRLALQLLNRLLLFNLFTSQTGHDKIQQMLDETELLNDLPDDSRERLDNLIFHMRANLAGQRRLGELKEDFIAVPSDRLFSELNRDHEAYRQSTLRLNRSLKTGLSLLVIVLILGLWLTMRRWDSAHHAAERSWSRLHDAVESIAEAFALFDRDGRLVLYNRRYLEFYPWLEELLAGPATLEQVRQANADHLKPVPVSDEEMEVGIQMEQTDDGRWYLASDNRTSEGGTVLVRIDITRTRQAEAELRKLGRALEQSPVSVVITDTEGIIEYVNPKFEAISGYRAEQAIGQNPRILKGGERSPESYREMWETLVAGHEWRGTFHNRRPDGSGYWESASISPLRNERGEITHYIAVKEDITERRQAEQQLRMSAAVFDTTTEGIMVTDPDGTIRSVNPAFCRITGYSAEEVLGRSQSLLCSDRHDAGFYRQLRSRVEQEGQWTGEVWHRRRDGSVYPAWLSIATVRDKRGEATSRVALFSDITQRKEDERRIRYQANYDALTRLPNRTLLLDRLVQAIASARRERWALGLMFVDLDHFKGINDTFGHATGDRLLQQVAERIRRAVRESDTVARFGGDEFVVLLQDIRNAGDAALVAEQIIATLSSPFQMRGREIFIGASIGITLYPDDAGDADALLQNADMAMYQAKESGRNRYQFFTPRMQEQVQQRLSLEQDLRLALERNELELHYQPIVETGTRRAVSAEALLRWHHPREGLITPDRFISIAEETGLIGPIGKWVLETACHQLAQWRAAGLSDLCISVNLSRRQRDSGLTGTYLDRLLSATGLPGDALSLEITESLLMEDTRESIAWLSELKTRGITLSVDDFGTGYSSLGYLKRFPVDVIKIDRSFIMDLPDDSDDIRLVETIVAMGRSLGHRLVAEGVETRAQMEILERLGCHYQQGYLFSRPLPPEQCGQWLDEHYARRDCA
ncbi:MAG TPA: EAL domain-containing protein [Sedimenticola thiotaurini]|uniref:cyclic-guanylate-specific phosphodiesterase n=1 Tax=Sedimenticola thiotaurini TaxID=1543721 RepID=A0A831RN40_9GAMM|nr:EAL domain-containing protein [Sedimenticola thiotaurini]